MLYSVSEDRYFTTRGAGRPTILPIWQVPGPQAEILLPESMLYFPYSATPPLSLGSQKTPLSGEAFEDMKKSLGNLWSLPWDHRLHFTFQSIDVLSSLFYHGRSNSIESTTRARHTIDPHYQLATLEAAGGSFVIYDIDYHGSNAVYSLGCKYTAADAEEVSLRIEPSLFSVETAGSSSRFFFRQPPFTAPWRRLM